MSLELSGYSQELLDDLAAPIARGDIEIVHDLVPLVNRLVSAYPFQMDRLAWHAIADVCKLAAPPGRAQSSFTLVEPATELREFWSRMRRDNQLRDDTSVIVVGDSLIDFALKLSAATLTEYLVVILSIPHHTYVFPDDVAWCFGYMMEDDAFFARRPSPARP